MLHCFSPGQLPTRPIITVGVCYTVSALDSSPPLLSTQSAFASRCQHWKTPLATPLRVLQHWQSNVCWRGGRSHVDDHMDITRLEEVEEEEEEEGGRGWYVLVNRHCTHCNLGQIERIQHDININLLIMWSMIVCHVTHDIWCMMSSIWHDVPRHLFLSQSL